MLTFHGTCHARTQTSFRFQVQLRCRCLHASRYKPFDREPHLVRTVSCSIRTVDMSCRHIGRAVAIPIRCASITVVEFGHRVKWVPYVPSACCGPIEGYWGRSWPPTQVLDLLCRQRPTISKYLQFEEIHRTNKKHESQKLFDNMVGEPHFVFNCILYRDALVVVVRLCSN